MATPLSGAQFLVNNEIVEYMANSLKYDLGSPERKVDPQVIGNGSVNNIATEDFSTAKAKITVDLKTTIENQAKVNTWITNFDANVGKVIASDGTAIIFEKATIINKPEFDTGADGIISLEFESQRAVFG